MKKWFALALAAMMMLATLTGCGGTESGGTQQTQETDQGQSSSETDTVVYPEIPAKTGSLTIGISTNALSNIHNRHMFEGLCGATSFLRNSDKIYEKKRNASQAPGRRFWPSAAARTRTRSWRPLWTRWWPPGSLIVRSVGWRWTTRPTPCDCYCSKWGGM